MRHLKIKQNNLESSINFIRTGLENIAGYTKSVRAASLSLSLRDESVSCARDGTE